MQTASEILVIILAVLGALLYGIMLGRFQPPYLLHRFLVTIFGRRMKRDDFWWWFDEYETPYRYVPRGLVFRFGHYVRMQEHYVGVELSPEAKKMLFLPILELARKGEEINWDDISESIRVLLVSMKEEENKGERHVWEHFTTRSLIRAFWRKYCNIPPFCGRTDDREK